MYFRSTGGQQHSGRLARGGARCQDIIQKEHPFALNIFRMNRPVDTQNIGSSLGIAAD